MTLIYHVWSQFLGVTVLVFCHLILVPVALIHRNFARQVLLPGICRLMLRNLGIRVTEIARPTQLPDAAVYIANHSSTLDIFVYNLLHIPRLAFFLTGYDPVVMPIYLPAWSLGTFFTASQADTEQRRRIFAAAAHSLAKSNDNVLLTPEGQRYTDGSVGAFNKGAFHLAVSLGRPIVPLFIDIERRIDPGMGLQTAPGNVQVFWGRIVTDLPRQFDGSRELPNLFQSWYSEFNEALKNGVPLQNPSNPFYGLGAMGQIGLKSERLLAADRQLDL